MVGEKNRIVLPRFLIQRCFAALARRNEERAAGRETRVFTHSRVPRIHIVFVNKKIDYGDTLRLVLK